MQGLYNPLTKLWNTLEQPFDNAMDWHYPQFLHNTRRHQEFRAEHDASLLPQVTAGEHGLRKNQVLIHRVGGEKTEAVTRIYLNLN